MWVPRGMFRDEKMIFPRTRGLEAVNGHRQLRFEVRTRYMRGTYEYRTLPRDKSIVVEEEMASSNHFYKSSQSTMLCMQVGTRVPA
jgi:hypothetical protein